MTLALKIQGLSKRYHLPPAGERGQDFRDAVAGLFRRRGKRSEETFWALRDVSFEVDEGEIIGVIGRNGAGKSTMLKILSRITEPTTGFVEAHGRVASLLEVGTGFHPELSGRENVFLNGAILGMRTDEIKRKFDEIVAFSEVEKFLETPVKHYSSGMYLRLAFAVAAHLEPEILLVDEVLAVGDAAFQRKCLGKMGEVANSGRTVLLVSHNLAAVSGLTKRSVLLDRGQLVAMGETHQVIEKYISLGETDVMREKPSNGILQVERCDIKGEQTSDGESAVLSVPFGKPLELEIDVNLKQAVPRGAFFVRLTDMKDVIIYTGLSYDNADWSALPEGRTRISHRVELPLAPGRYWVSFGVMDQARKHLGRLERIGSVQVLYPATDWVFDDRRGTMVVRGDWSISPCE